MKLISVLVLTIFLLSVPVLFYSISVNATVTAARQDTHLPRNAPVSSTQGGFVFVSNFESETLEGWRSVSSLPPSIVSKTNYYGEPSLASEASAKGPQVDVATQGFVTGDSFVSFQVAINAQRGSGYFGLEGPKGFVAAILV